MTRSRGTSRVRLLGTRNLTRVVVAGVVVAGAPLALAGTANAATSAAANAATSAPTASDGVWDQIAQCESGGKWNTSTGNGYSGGLQFAPSTWRAYGGKGNAHQASRAQQISVAQKVQAAQGWGAWPSCSKKAGVKGKSSQSASVHSGSVHSGSVHSGSSRGASATISKTTHFVKKHYDGDDDD
jgi:resuscitation-promoting factor RpfA